jgi:hypothetical protein
MRRKGTNEQLAERRARGLALLAEGKTAKEVGAILEVTKRSGSLASGCQKAKEESKPLTGVVRKLSTQQTKRLEKALDKGAYAFGYAELTGP